MPHSRTDHRNRNPFLQGRGRPTVACHIRGQRSLQFQYSGYLVEAFVVYPQCTSVLLVPLLSGCADDGQQIDGFFAKRGILTQDHFGAVFYDYRKLLSRFLAEINEHVSLHIGLAEMYQVDKRIPSGRSLARRGRGQNRAGCSC